jgi:hypothetical protein
MRRRLLIGLLALGTVGGYGMGFASMRCHARERHARFEEHLAKVCTDAARDGERRGRPERFERGDRFDRDDRDRPRRDDRDDR